MEQRELWIQHMICFQAWCRGFLVRKELQSAQTEFEEIVQELEGSLDHLSWKGQFIPKPHFTDQESTLFRYFRPRIQTQEDPVKPKEPDRGNEEALLNSDVLQAEKDGEPRDTDRRETATPLEGDRDAERRGAETAGDLSSTAMESYSSLLEKGHQTRSLLQDEANSPESLRQHRRTLAMELMWIQQAIASRKKYLTLKQKMDLATMD